MAGLLDFLGMGQQPGGLLGAVPQQQEAGGGNWWTTPNPSFPMNAAMGFGMGMLSGSNRGEGWANAMKGMQGGMQADRVSQKDALRKAAIAKARMPDGSIDYGRLSAALMEAGDTEAGASIARVAESAADRKALTAHRGSLVDLQRQQETRAGELHPLQKAQLEAETSAKAAQAKKLQDDPHGLNTLIAKGQIEQRMKAAASDAKLQEGGKTVLSMVEHLEQKIGGPETEAGRKTAQKFEGATGPYVGPASEGGWYNPARWAYESGVMGGSREDSAYLDRIKADAQAINSTMQRALLEGGGSITEGERADVNKILGAIHNARDAKSAREQLGNFKGLVRRMFKIDAGGAAAAPDPLGIR